MDKVELGLRVVQLRTARGLSQAELARRVGLKAGTSMLRIEKGKSMPSAETLKALARELGVTMEQLTESSGDRFEEATPTDDERDAVYASVGIEASDTRKYELLMALRRAERRRADRAAEQQTPAAEQPPPGPPFDRPPKRRDTRRVG